MLRVDGTQALGHAAVGMLEADGDLLHCLRLQVGLHLPAERCTLNERSSLSPDPCNGIELFMQDTRPVSHDLSTEAWKGDDHLPRLNLAKQAILSA